ncbi:hypothetical protein LTR20_006975 [Exophiala xenobiotica]|nr:hypothetical protein LTR40_007309 [Exophiala xenobiotica]KAK5380582.1 hypothetical protein LTS13_003441 [Exophiala xenobiotica]KAK5392924.1 hypothetical protein LTR79_009827 [Exophiala xenobiotica]KAK5411979.1 hypothetical protein LTR90_007540 [Exophiala xenobiotica]KAK5447561.1 hypothetical protein LTR18_003142 [Exophiala xenobiotica]
MTNPSYLFFVLAAYAPYYANASPIALPQAVTALISPPLSGPSPPDCTGGFSGVFGIAVMNISVSETTTSSAATTTTLPRRRRQEAGSTGPSTPTPIFTMAGVVSQIGDGQVQGGMHTHTLTMAVVSQIGDGQIQNPTDAAAATAAATPSSATGGGGVASAAFAAVYSGQQQEQSAACTTATASSASSTSTSIIGDSKPPTVLEQACGISVRPTPTPTLSPVMLLPPTTSISNVQSTSSSSSSTNRSASSSSTSTTENAPGGPLSLVSCLTNSTLRLTLNDGVLLDGKNRTGYIASNWQFQFDGPPQSGAIYTAGWSVCPVDTDGGQALALGGNTTFYQCLSGKFYNLYTENWAAQCSPVQLRVVRLVDC